MSKKLQERKAKFKFDYTDIEKTIKSLDPLQISEYITSKKIEFESKAIFLMFFTGQLALNYELSITECSMLFEILHKYVGYKNIVYIGSEQRKTIANELEIDPGSISKALKTLRDKEIIVVCDTEEKHEKLNPYLFGDNDFQSISLMETRITKKFNFKDRSVSIIESVVIDQEDEIIETQQKRRNTDCQENALSLQMEVNRELELRLQIYQAKIELHKIGALTIEEAKELN